jgi:putative FmdB family regulatory protein
MPFYEYECRNCGHELEAMQKVSDPPLKKCPDCGKPQLKRLMSAPVFRLKGGGWYETDFKGENDKQRNLADRPDADAPKDATKDAGKDAAKDAGKAADGAAGKDAAPTTADKPADKPAADSAKKADAAKPRKAKSSPRIHTPGRGKSAAKRPIKRPVHKAKLRG